jgi:hypothetical protein
MRAGRISPLFLTVLIIAAVAVLYSPLNHRDTEVDIRAGRIRHSRSLAFLPLSDRVTDSVITKALPPEFVARTKPEWHTVNSFSPGSSYSAHFAFHGAESQIDMLESIWSGSSLEPGLREKTARQVLALWQEDGGYFPVNYFLNRLYDLTSPTKRDALVESLRALEIPRVEKRGGRVIRTYYYPDGKPMERYEGYLNDSGSFVKDGAWERWYPNGRKELYGHLRDGEHHGRRFDWNDDGTLAVIEAYNHGNTSEFESQNLERHPDFAKAKELAARP